MAKKIQRGTELKRFLDQYQAKSGASRRGAFRDIATDLLHLGLRDAKLKKELGIKRGHNQLTIASTVNTEIMAGAFSMFLEELEDDK